MYQNREEFIAALGVAEMPALFGARFAQTMAEYEKNGVFYLEDAFLADLQSTYHLFHQKYDYVKLAAKRVRKNAFWRSIPSCFTVCKGTITTTARSI